VLCHKWGVKACRNMVFNTPNNKRTTRTGGILSYYRILARYEPLHGCDGAGEGSDIVHLNFILRVSTTEPTQQANVTPVSVSSKNQAGR